MKLKTSKGTIIIAESKFISKGGQGSVHKVLSPGGNPQQVVKLYFPDFLKKTKPGGRLYSDILEEKISFMVNNNPFTNVAQKIKDAFAWPVDLLYDDNNNFTGYLMPFVKDSLTLSQINSFTPLPSPWNGFQLNNPGSYNTRLKVCYNIAQAIEMFHASGFYTLVDLKADNIMLRKNGFISLIDLDSIQISQNNTQLFQAEVVTPEFCPPEHHNKLVDFSAEPINQSWDLFSLAVLFYKLLFNIHPFGGLTHKRKPEYHTDADFISKGIFAHGKYRNQISLAPPHSNFHQLLDQSLQELFQDCFDKGHKTPSLRPSASKWRTALLASIQLNAGKKINGGINQPVGITIQSRAKPNPLFNGNKLIPADQLNEPTILNPIVCLTKRTIKCAFPSILSIHINQPISTLRIKQIACSLMHPKITVNHSVSLIIRNNLVLRNPAASLVHGKSKPQKAEKLILKALVIVYFLVVFQLAIMYKQPTKLKL